MSNKTVYSCHFEAMADRDIFLDSHFSKADIAKWKDMFKNYFLKGVKRDKDNYYMFIITDTQMPEFNKHLDKYGIAQYIIAKREGCRNQNYRWRNHPKLTWFIFNFPETFTLKD